MANAAKFLFGTDFRKPEPDARQSAALADAEARGYMRGIADGLRQAEAEAKVRSADAQMRVATAMDQVGHGVAELLATLDDHLARTEALAVDLAVTLGRKLAGDVLAREPLAAIAEAAAQSFQHLRGVPHLVVRVNDALVEDVDAMVLRLARDRGFEGRLVTLGDPDIPPGDVRLEWADGGIARDRTRIDEAVAKALGRTR
jgi:flagellar assembly protein FliH